MPEKAEGNFLVIPGRVSKKRSTDCFQTEEIHGMVHKQMPLGKLRDTNCVPAGQRQLEFSSTDSSRLQPSVSVF